jgi:hypothetical protein
MKSLLWLSLIFFALCIGCKKEPQEIEKVYLIDHVEGTYTDLENELNPNITVTKYDADSVSFKHQFHRGLTAILTASFDSCSNTLRINPLERVGAASGTHYRVLDGEITFRDNSLSVEIFYIYSPDCNVFGPGPVKDNCISESKSEWSLYTRDPI